MKSKINIYIENYTSKISGDIVEYTIDFDTIENAENFFQLFFPDFEYNPNKFYNLRTPNSGRHRMFSGSWYSLPTTIFEQAEYESIDEEAEGSGGYSGVIKVKNKITNFTDYLAIFKNEEYEVYEDIDIDFATKLQTLMVVNCGQGNWNEIHAEKELLIYDMGASSRHTSAQIKSLVDNRFSKFKGKTVGIIISHWDMDHFQAIKYLDSKQLSQISAIYGPSNIPISNVYTSTIKHLIANNVNYKLIAPTTKRNGRAINLNQLSTSKTVDVYRSVNGSSRNQTGIVLAIKGNLKVALLTGDHHYEKIFSVIDQKYTNQDIILVIPHHGGNAGRLSISDWQTEFNTIECAISYGLNSYNHPSQNIGNIIALQSAYPETTYDNGDLAFNI